jgi:hypothetical protein
LIAIPLTLFKLIAGKVAISGNLAIAFYASVIILTIGFILWKLYLIKTREAKLLLTLIFVPLLSAWLISFFVPINNPPRLIFILPFILLAVAYFIVHSQDKHLIYIFMVISFFGIFMQNYIPKNMREDWRGAVNYIQDKEETYGSKNKVAVLFEFGGPFAPWIWYSNNKIPAFGAVNGKADEKEIEMRMGANLINKNRVYLFEYFADVTDSNRLVRKFLETNGFHVVNFYDFNNLGFIYEFWKPRAN